MSGKLTDTHMDLLEQWIGTGPKTFTLLYAITRDGCNATTFHQKCDNQGPTVTMLYNKQDSVYGGYAPVSWNSMGGQYVNNNTAFLFQLQFNGNNKTVKFPVKQDCCQHAMYNRSCYGPTFGGGHDLFTFKDTIQSSGTYFILNGSTNFGYSYEMQGITANGVNNGNMNVTELEVYRVTDGKTESVKTIKPWRKTKDWDKKFLDELKEVIVAFKPVEDLEVENARILMIGPVGTGKSSFYNTVNSIFRGHITQRAGCGSVEQSLTKAYTPYKVEVRPGATLNFRLCDTRGLEESQGLDVIECNYLLDGNIPNYYQFNPAEPISPKSQGFKANPTADDMIQCAVFVLDATTLEVLSPKLLEKIKSFQSLMYQKGIPQVILLTKIDKLCKEVQEDVSFTFKSPAIEKHVDKASQMLWLPRANVLPIKNYENEVELDENVNILALLSLRQILYFAQGFMENILEKKNDEKNEAKDFKHD